MGILSHQSARMQKDEWLTPPDIIRSLGEFDLDPCSPVNRPWATAKEHYTIKQNGLMQKWFGRVWLNPPYGSGVWKWLDMLSSHGNGIALIFARTETDGFFKTVFNRADSILFIKGRLTFHHVDGSKASGNGGSPSVLVAYGSQNTEALKYSGINGKLIKLKSL